MLPMPLWREVPCRRRRRIRFDGIATVLAIGLSTTVLVGLVAGPRRTCCGGESKVDIAKATVKKYAFEAYPSWAAAHLFDECPRSLLELNEYMNNKDIRDPWGRDYFMVCGNGKFLVFSAG
jgi:hypothetical protein